MSVDRAQALYRQALATELRCEGRQYAEIAEILGYAGKSGAWHAVQRALKARTVSAANHLVATSFLDLDLVQSSAWPAAMDGNLAAVEKVLRAISLRVHLIERFGTELGLPDECMQAADAADAYLAKIEERSKVSRDPQDVFENSDVFAFVQVSGALRGRTAVVSKRDKHVDLLGVAGAPGDRRMIRSNGWPTATTPRG